MLKNNSRPVDESSEEEEALDVKPLRTLSPVFQSPVGLGSITPPNPQPVFYVSPYGPCSSTFLPGVTTGFPAPFPPQFGTPEAPFSVEAEPVSQPVKNGSIYTARTAPQTFRTAKRERRRGSRSFRQLHSVVPPVNGSGDTVHHSVTSYGRKVRKPSVLGSVYSENSYDLDDSNERKPPNRPVRREKIPGLDISFLSSSKDPRWSVESVLMTFDALRRRLTQLDDGDYASKRPDLRAATILLTNEFRANAGKRIGPTAGVEIGDIFYFRMELCLVGLHSPSMAGIDFMNDQNDTIAISIVSSGGYENEEDDVDVLIYSGSGGGGKHDRKFMDDQKLVRGNLALERSLFRDNSIRVIRSAKDATMLNGKIYIYDGLYKVNESWDEKGRLGFKVFKFKLLREPGQPSGIATWKMAQKWKEDPSSRGGIILLDISSGVENLPVCLVNDVDGARGPSVFQYVTTAKYRRPLAAMNPLQGCECISVCLPGDRSCGCVHQNGGNLPYSSNGLLVCHKPVIYECNASCRCSENCRNRVSQKGTRVQFEVFRTRDRGWGLRSWDPIRAGAFLCEYTGEVIGDIGIDDDIEDNDYIFRSNPVGEKTLKWNYGPELVGEATVHSANEDFKSLPTVISAKNMGNVSRFMNHSCSPNVFWQAVQHDHNNKGSPHIMFFALLHIPPMRELTFDYGNSDPKFGRSKKCLCGSQKCRGIFG